MEAISTLDIFKLGVGPSSSHTMGPWRAALRFLTALTMPVQRVEVHLYGSLAKTGKGHGTDIAVQLGLMGYDPASFDTRMLASLIEGVRASHRLVLGNGREVPFDPATDIVFHRNEALPEHPNGVVFRAVVAGTPSPSANESGLADEASIEKTYFSIGGGFVLEKGEDPSVGCTVNVPHAFRDSGELEVICRTLGLSIPQVALLNEDAFRPRQATLDGLDLLARTMLECVYEGCHTDGVLPGGLNVTRRAEGISRQLIGDANDQPLESWMEAVKGTKGEFETAVRWVSCFALAVNEVNAAFGRVVTAPTNGAAGVVPAVLLYHWFFGESSVESIREFLLTAAQVAIVFKRNATISAAMGGCQAEIGVSSAMAAAAFAHVRGGSTAQALMAAEIAMEHHLGMTCDPIGGLVQIPCIERNTMGAMKAITAARIALDSDPSKARVSLDDVVDTMWRTAIDMNHKYKETSEGGLAVQIPVNVSEC